MEGPKIKRRTFPVGGAFPALASLNDDVKRVAHFTAHDLVVELLGHILVAERKARVRLEEHKLLAAAALPLQHLRVVPRHRRCQSCTGNHLIHQQKM
jgi:hypothetical protein